jgi:L-ascorbate metabolism protein UlaG (beta-lactamase superfamily)
MELQFYGADCIALTTKQARVLIDDNLADLGAKTVAKAGDISLFTGAHASPAQPSKIIIDQAGEYEVSGISVYGIPARGHMDEEGKKTAVMYKIVADELRILVTGHIYPELSDEQLETIGMIDVMLVPVGGNGYTMDPIGAFKVVKKVEPKVVIPTHFDDQALKFPVPQQPLEEALKAFPMELKETVAKLKLKSTDLSDAMQLIVLAKS